MTSPFDSIEAFNGAIDGPTEGAIYTFAANPAINNIALLVAVALFVWFIFATYTTRHELPKVDKTLNSLSALFVVGLLTLVSAEYRKNPDALKTAGVQQERQALTSRRSVQIPLGMLGMVGIGLPRFGKRNQRRLSDRRSKSRRF